MLFSKYIDLCLVKTVSYLRRVGPFIQALGFVSALLFSPDAFALSCDEIAAMVDYELPSEVVINTIKGSGSTFTSEDVQCLLDKDVPTPIVDEVKRLSGWVPGIQSSLEIGEIKALEEQSESEGSVLNVVIVGILSMVLGIFFWRKQSASNK